MLKIALLVFTLLALASGNALAAIGVTIGHHAFDPDDHLPVISPGEQVSVFYCKGKMTGPEAMECSFKKCLAKFKRENACVKDGWSTKRGYSVAMVGPKGDNRFIYSKALGDPTREEAMRYVATNNFPVAKATIVIDLFDEGDEPADGTRSRGKAHDEELSHRVMQRDM